MDREEVEESFAVTIDPMRADLLNRIEPLAPFIFTNCVTHGGCYRTRIEHEDFDGVVNIHGDQERSKNTNNERTNDIR